jgi:hypothetical protein
MKTAQRKSTKRKGDPVNVKGFFRVQLTESGKVVGDSGWHSNLVVNNGFSNYLTDLLGAGASSKFVSRMMLGSGTDPAATDNTLNGEFNTATYTRTTVTFANVGSKTARFTATFASANSHILASTTLGNIGIINNTTSAGTMMAAKSFATSQWNTNQDVNATYEIRFS